MMTGIKWRLFDRWLSHLDIELEHRSGGVVTSLNELAIDGDELELYWEEGCSPADTALELLAIEEIDR